MENLTQYLPVNWIDGMKISKHHFIQNNNFIHNALIKSHSNFLNSFNFGLLPGSEDSQSSLELTAEEFNGRFQISLKSCNAITEGGVYIQFKNKNNLNFSITPDHESEGRVTEYVVIVSINPFERVPVGTPDINENPPRHPFSDAGYELTAVPIQQINKNYLSPYQLIIGRLNYKSGILTLDKKNIPPSSRIHSHSHLVTCFESFGHSFQNINGLALKVLRKIHEKNRPSSISKNYKILCEAMVDYNSTSYFKYKNIIANQAPIFMLEYFSNLANLMYSKLQQLSSEEREEILKYTFEWCEIKPGDLNEILVSASNMQYDHYKITFHTETIQKLLQTLESVWTRIDSLEFIGQRKENMVVTKEVVTQQAEPAKKRWSILD